MTLAVWFWLFYVLALLFGGWRTYNDRATAGYWFGGWGLLLFILLGILGYHAFGSAVK